MKSIAVVLLGLALVASVMALDFGYDDTSTSLPGPSSWGTLPGSQVCSTGRFQSPINIISSFVEYHANYGRLAYTYTKDSQITITETGHTVFLSSTGFADNTLTVKNVLNGTYVLDNIVFHWGQDNSVGSEHLVDFVPTVGEIQFVHYNNMFASLTTAISSKQFDAVAIISVPLVIGRSSPKNFTALVNNMNTTAGPMSSSIVGPLDFTTFFPANKVYYTYSGSLTTPTCDEVVQWFVFANPLKVSQTDFNRLRKVPLETSATTFGAGSNYRPTQTLYGRKVTSNFIPNNQASSASGLVASLVLCLCAAVMALTGF